MKLRVTVNSNPVRSKRNQHLCLSCFRDTELFFRIIVVKLLSIMQVQKVFYVSLHVKFNYDSSHLTLTVSSATITDILPSYQFKMLKTK